MVNNGSDMHGFVFLNNTYCDESNRPIQDIRIYNTIIIDDPYGDPDSLIIPPVSLFLTEEMLNNDHIDEEKTDRACRECYRKRS